MGPQDVGLWPGRTPGASRPVRTLCGARLPRSSRPHCSLSTHESAGACAAGSPAGSRPAGPILSPADSFSSSPEAVHVLSRRKDAPGPSGLSRSSGCCSRSSARLSRLARPRCAESRSKTLSLNGYGGHAHASTRKRNSPRSKRAPSLQVSQTIRRPSQKALGLEAIPVPETWLQGPRQGLRWSE